MLSLSHCQRIFLARAPTDMRKGANGLSAVVRERLGKDPLGGDAFVFVSRRRNYIKILVWDVSGFWVASKRLERGTYAVGNRLGRRASRAAQQLSVAELMNILEGIDVHHAVYHRHEGDCGSAGSDVGQPCAGI
jgi:transposase